MTPAAPSAASTRTSCAVRPPTVVYMPPSFMGTEPVTTSRYSPRFSFMVC